MENKIVKDIALYYMLSVIGLIIIYGFIIQITGNSTTPPASLIAIILTCYGVGATYAKQSETPIPKNVIGSIAGRGALIIAVINGIFLIVYAILANMVGIGVARSTITFDGLLL
ncbi:MAG: hypothetical protein AAF603_09145, partial [Pseudomonadota bacterium]